MLRIVIFDDEERIGMQLKRLLEELDGGVTAEYFRDWESLQAHVMQHLRIDAVFMDLNFRGSRETGIDYAEKIAAWNLQTKVIYVAGYSQDYAERIFLSKTVKPYGFLQKPFERDKVRFYLDSLQEEHERTQDQFLFRKVGGEVISLELPQILYFSSEKRKVCAHTTEQVYEGYYRLSDLTEELPEYFYQCHKSYVLNLRHVSRVDTKRVAIGKIDVPISAFGHRSIAECRQELVSRISRLHL